MKNSKLTLLLAMALTAALLSGCGGPAQQTIGGGGNALNEELGIPEGSSASSIPDQTPEPATPPATPEKTEPSSAVTDGKLIYTLDSDDMLLDANADAGWFTAGGMGKGYGTRYMAVNLATGQVIEGEEGAEVVLCGNAIIQFVWRDADGNQIGAGDMYYYTGSAPKEATLYAVVYGLDGQVKEEKAVLTMAQSAKDPYYDQVYPVMEQTVKAYGGGHVAGYAHVLKATDDGGDAVVSDDRGELVRIPGADASMTYGTSVSDGRFVAVYRPDTNETEVYQFD